MRAMDNMTDDKLLQAWAIARDLSDLAKKGHDIMYDIDCALEDMHGSGAKAADDAMVQLWEVLMAIRRTALIDLRRALKTQKEAKP